MTLDPRLHAIRPGLADARLRGRVEAPRYAEARAARVALGLVPLRRAPQAGAPLDTFFHYGEAVRVFDETDGFAWCQSRRDGYVGYVEAAALVPDDMATPTHYLASLGAYRYAAPDLRAPVIDFLPRHSPVVVAQAGLMCRGTAYAGLDGGGFLPEACLSLEPPHSPDLAAAAALYLGCPYLWGGRSFLGLDCSGLVQEAFRDLGSTVLRDTDMQRGTIGAAVTVTRLAELRRNDLIYIPGHVMIAAGRGRVIHASGHEMTVRHDSLAMLLRRWGHRLDDLAVRRPCAGNCEGSAVGR
ncbi:MAG TPA: NlpC/P60 family protein [Stellaceae bacterium]|nr:NlpC/P60 family protein [Stellaceae bacterium]